MPSTHLLALLLFLLLGAVDSLEDNFKEIEDHVDILKGNKTPPTRTPKEEAQLERDLEEALDSVIEPANARQENIVRINEIVKMMQELAYKQHAQKIKDYNAYAMDWYDVTPPKSLFDKQSTNPPKTTMSTVKNSNTEETVGTSTDELKTTPEETKSVETTPEDSEGIVMVETTTSVNVKDTTTQNGDITQTDSGDFTSTTTGDSEGSTDRKKQSEQTTQGESTPEEKVPEKATTESQKGSSDHETSTEYFTVDTTTEDRSSEESFKETTAEENSQRKITPVVLIPTRIEGNNGNRRNFGPGASGVDSRKKRSLPKEINTKLNIKKPKKIAGLKFLEKVEVRNPETSEKTVINRLSGKRIWYGPNSGSDIRKLRINTNRIRNLLNLEKLNKVSDRKKLENSSVRGSDDRQENINRLRLRGKWFGPGRSGVDSRRKRSMTNEIHSKKVAVQGPGLGKLLSDATGDKLVFV